jgi:SAM-dependent methyltransferase
MPMPDDRAIVQLQKLADANDLADPEFDFVARDCLRIRPGLHPRIWEYVMAYRGLDRTGMLRGERRGIAFGSGREPLMFAAAMRAGFLCVTDLYTGSTIWDTARTTDPRDFVLAAAPADFDPSRIEVRNMDMREIEYPDHCFDFAYSISAVEHIGFDADFVRHLREVRRVLKPDGVYVLTTELRIRGKSFRVEGNHSFDFDHLLSLFRESGMCIAPHFDARLADRIENEGRESTDTRYRDASNNYTALGMVREVGGITSLPGLFVLRPGNFQDVEIVGLAETARWLQEKLDFKVNLAYSEWATLNPYGMMIGSLSPYCDLWRTQSAPADALMFATAYRYFGNGEMEVRVTVATSADAASSGTMAVCINAWSLHDVADIISVAYEQVEIAGDEMVARRCVFRIQTIADRSYCVFAVKVSGEILLGDVVVMVRRPPDTLASTATDHAQAAAGPAQSMVQAS